MFFCRPYRSSGSDLRCPRIDVFQNKQLLKNLNIRIYSAIRNIVSCLDVRINAAFFSQRSHISSIRPKDRSRPLRIISVCLFPSDDHSENRRDPHYRRKPPPILTTVLCKKKETPGILRKPLKWSYWRESNSQPRRYECRALPLSHSSKLLIYFIL